MKIRSWEDPVNELKPLLVGNKIVAVDLEKGLMRLSDGIILKFDTDNSECCSSSYLNSLGTVSNLITDVKMVEDEVDGEERARIVVISEVGWNSVEAEAVVAECITDPSSGYYLHGWSLDIEVINV